MTVPSLGMRLGCSTFSPSRIRMSGRSTVTVLAGHHIVDEVRIDRGRHLWLAGLHIGEEAQDRRAVIALREALALHQAAPLELGIGQEEAVGGDELDLGRVGPAREQRLEHARRGRLADGDRAGDADDVGDLDLGLGHQEALRRLEQPLRGRDIEREQARERQVDRDDLVERDRIVDRLQLGQVVDRERQRRIGAQMRPLVARESCDRASRDRDRAGWGSRAGP